MTAQVGAQREALTVEIRTVDLSDRAPADARTLNDSERARAARFRHAHHARRWIRARSALRAYLGAAVGTPPERLRFRTEAFGKPMLEGEPATALAFNLSHSADMAIIAWSLLPSGLERAPLLGVDVEAIVPVPELAEVARHHFAPEEQAALLSTAVEERTAAFHRLWTRKEAFVKALGLGIGAPLERFAVSLDPAEARLTRADSALFGAPDRWRLLTWEPSPGYAAALAVRDAGGALRLADGATSVATGGDAPC